MNFKCVTTVQDIIDQFITIITVVIVQERSFLLTKGMKGMKVPTVTNASLINVLQTDPDAHVEDVALILVSFAEVCGN
ncbi:hypothetical protein [Paenisporosarcina indica]|uniref:hypothetical protein n=1 Tax=Paenisporosarcina indica TaxID=650093 RepID=UPI00095011DC|nr:hypothetical protein [Paenisporosarcina indica]